MNPLSTLLPLTDHPVLLLLALVAVVVAYMVFTLAGFGSALISSAPLAMVMPVSKVIPVLALLDCGNSSLRGWRARGEVAWGEIKWLLPGMILGQVFGVMILARMPTTYMALVLGGFVCLQGIKGLWPVKPGAGTTLPRYPLVRGIFGGVLGGVFGMGGFIYAAYLERRLESRTAFRASQAVMMAISTGWRVILCIWIGLIDAQTFVITLTLIPMMVLGIFLGHHLDLRMSRKQLFMLLNILLVVSGTVLILKHWG